MTSTISDYFEQKFGKPPNESSLLVLPVDSNCGRDCKEVIDAAAKYIEVLDHHIGLPEYRASVIELTNQAVEILWLG